jgi:hypothetical protein
MTSMFQLYSGSRPLEHRPESEYDYFMRMAAGARLQRRQERRRRVINRLTGRPHGKQS